MRWIERLLRRHDADERLGAELRDHIERRVADYVARGHGELAARRMTRLEFGPIETVKDQCRDVRRGRVAEDFLRDLRYGLRVLRKSPGFTLAAIASLALGIGANTAIFSIINAALLTPLSVREPHRLVELLTDRGNNDPFNAFSYVALMNFHERAKSLEGVIASHSWRFFVAIDGAAPEMAAGQYVTGNFFPVLGVPAVTGRIIQDADDRANAEPVAVLSHGYWQRRFGGDPRVVGRTMAIESRAFTIAGVAASEFTGTQIGRQVDFWIPLAAEPSLRSPSWTSSAGYKWLQILGRLRPDVSLEEAAAELRTIFATGVVEAEVALLAEARSDHPARRWRLDIESAGAGLSAVRRQYGEPLLVLMALTGIVLVIACVNVANLLFARAAVRRLEIAVRMSLGAGRSRVVRQLLTESALLSLAGTFVGVTLAFVAGRFLLAFFATGRSQISLDVAPDLRVLLYTACVALATGVLVGTAPAWRATRATSDGFLVRGGRVLGRESRGVSGRLLIGSQVALAMIALFGAALLLRSLNNLRSLDAGFDRNSVLLISTDPSRSGLTSEARHAAYRAAIVRLNAIPGVRAASLSVVTPIEGGGIMLDLRVEREDGTREEAANVHVNRVSPEYFAAMRTPLYAGREFSWDDVHSGSQVAIINETMARRYFPGANPIGQRVELDAARFEIVGVAGDSKYLELRDAVPPTIYFHLFQGKDVAGQFAIRTAGPPAALTTAAREAIRTAAPQVTLTDVRTLEGQVAASIVRERMLGMLSSVFAGLALVLSAVGLYGVMAYTVSRRTSEIGIRMALGASPATIARVILQDASILTIGGALVGAAGGLLVSRFLTGLLFGLTATDPVSLAGAALVLLLTALAAAYLPARRAARLDPTVALRAE